MVPLALYPLLLLIITPRGKPEVPGLLPEELPEVDFIIAAHNEERTIVTKLHNTLSLSYPSEKLMIYVVSDGSTDATDDLVREFSPQVKLIQLDRQGKTVAQNHAVRQSSHEVLVFSDATAWYNENAILELVRPLQDDTVGVVGGELIYRSESDDNSANNGEAGYWSFEKWLRIHESRLFSTIGVSGTIYAVRRSAFTELDNWAVSDLMVPLFAVIKGWRTVFTPYATSIEKPVANIQHEFRARRRIVARGLKSVWSYRREIKRSPLKFRIMLFLHKILRWLLPLWIVLILLGFILSGHLLLQGTGLLIVMGLVTGAWIGQSLPGKTKPDQQVNLVIYFFTMTIACGLGIIDLLRGRSHIFWRPER